MCAINISNNLLKILPTGILDINVKIQAKYQNLDKKSNAQFSNDMKSSIWCIK